MATIDDFSPEELQQIQHAPVYVIAGAVASQTDGYTGSMREMIDGVEGFAAAMARAGDSLLTEIFQAIDQTQPDGFDIEEVSNEETRDAVVARGLEAAVGAYSLLKSKAGSSDADEYGKALIVAASAAVHAAKTGGFLGFGSDAVSEDEAEYVQRLTESIRPS